MARAKMMVVLKFKMCHQLMVGNGPSKKMEQKASFSLVL